MRSFLLPALLALACSSPEAPAVQELGDDRYTVSVRVPSVLGKGETGTLELAIRPKTGRHLSTEFPTRLELRADRGITVPAHLDETQATRLEEEAIDFVASLRADAIGAATIQGSLRVGVCTGELCEPVELHFESELRVREEGEPGSP